MSDIREIKITACGRFIEIGSAGANYWGSGSYSHSAQVLLTGASAPIPLARWAKAQGFETLTQDNGFSALTTWTVPMHQFLALSGMSFDHGAVRPPRWWIEYCTTGDAWGVHHTHRPYAPVTTTHGVVFEVIKKVVKEPFFDHRKRAWALRPSETRRVVRLNRLHWPAKAIRLP